MSTRVKRRLRDLIRDESIYPRNGVDSDRVLMLAEVVRASRKLPPPAIDQRNRLLDGWHRREALLLEFGLDHEIECLQYEVRDDGEALKLAAKLNASHGLPLSRSDRARCVRMASRFGIGAAAMAAILGTTVSALKAMGEGRVALAPRPRPTVVVPAAEPAATDRESEPVEEVVLSKTVEHLAGSTLTREQTAANRQLCGLPQLRLVEDLILLLESGSVDCGNERLMRRLRHLNEALSELFASGPVA